MITKRIDLTPDGRVYLDCYINDWTPLRPHMPRRPAIIVCPGGAYVVVGEREGEPVALAFAAKGYNAFVLHYSVGLFARFPNSMLDAARAVALIRVNAEEWNIDPDKVAVCGFSAGGHIAACLGTMWHTDMIQNEVSNAKPNAVLLGYPCISADIVGMDEMFGLLAGERGLAYIEQAASCERHVSDKTPPAFIFTSFTDKLLPVEHSLRFTAALAEHDVNFELHVFGGGKHGCSLASDATALGDEDYYHQSALQWFDLAVKWLGDIFGGGASLPVKYVSMLKPTATLRAHIGTPSMEEGVFDAMTTRAGETKRYSLSTRLGDVLENEQATAILKKFLPTCMDSPQLAESLELPVQYLVLSAGGSLSNEDIKLLSRELREVTR